MGVSMWVILTREPGGVPPAEPAAGKPRRFRRVKGLPARDASARERP